MRSTLEMDKSSEDPAWCLRIATCSIVFLL